MRIAGSQAEVELVLEALAKAGFRCKCNEKFYPYQDKGKTKYSIYLNELVFPIPERAAPVSSEHRSHLRALRGKPAELASQISKAESLLQSLRDELVLEVAQSDGPKPKPWDVVLGGKGDAGWL